MPCSHHDGAAPNVRVLLALLEAHRQQCHDLLEVIKLLLDINRQQIEDIGESKVAHRDVDCCCCKREPWYSNPCVLSRLPALFFGMSIGTILPLVIRILYAVMINAHK